MKLRVCRRSLFEQLYQEWATAEAQAEFISSLLSPTLKSSSIAEASPPGSTSAPAPTAPLVPALQNIQSLGGGGPVDSLSPRYLPHSPRSAPVHKAAPAGKKSASEEIRGVVSATAPFSATANGASATANAKATTPQPSPTPLSPRNPRPLNTATATAKVVLSTRNGEPSPGGVRAAQTLPQPSLKPPAKAALSASSPRSAKPSTLRPGAAANLPRFHFPAGKPSTSSASEVETCLAALSELGPRLREEDMSRVTSVLRIPLYWKRPLWLGGGGGAKGWLSPTQLASYWRSITAHSHDEAARFYLLLKTQHTRSEEKVQNGPLRPGSLGPLSREDFEPLIQDIVDSFPGLYFLREAPDFHSRYVQTVIARIFFVTDRSWSGGISLAQLRRSSFLSILRSLHTVEDINSVSEYFSYEHFYVIYCKFWDIDSDHDLFISKADLARHEGGCLTAKIIDRIFSGAVRPSGSDPERMSYAEFVAFLIAEEDKSQPASIEYWFRCLDVDGDGLISIYEMETFYSEVAAKMEGMSIEPMVFSNLVAELMDIVRPATPPSISLADLRRCRMAPFFFNSLLNVHKHYEQESSEGSDRAHLRNEAGEPLSEWERYCADEYEALMAAEAAEEEAADEEAESEPDILATSAPLPSKISQPFPLDAL